MVISSPRDAAVIAESAFGNDLSTWPLPEASAPDVRWLRAVALGGCGRYAAAHAELDTLTGFAGGSDRVRSLSLSTKASLIRQLGWHARARGLDGLALAAAGAHPEARTDALIGLAADALGLARFGLADALLDRARLLADGGDDRWPWRLPLRLAWVQAELAMVSGDGERSLRHARSAERLAAEVPSCRHRVKTAMVLAAALASTGQFEEAAQVAGRALDAATASGLTPLRWALSALLGGLSAPPGGGHDARAYDAIRRECAYAIAGAGGQWRTPVLD